MRIRPIAFDSLGARSMCTVIEAEDLRVIIDPSVALGPRRYGLPPHEVEVRRKEELWERIKSEAAKSDIVIITHYHYDHHNPNEPQIISGKILLIKHPESAINMSQRRRASRFLKSLLDLENPPDIRYADSKEFEFGDLLIRFSDPVFHGADSRLGYVLEVYMDDGKMSFLYTSDVEGLTMDEQVKFVLESEPDVLFMDGPMTYQPRVFGSKLLEKSIENLSKVMRSTGVKEIVLDHHLTRDIRWRDKVLDVFKIAEEVGVKVKSAAEFGGYKEELLEAMRRELYKGGKNAGQIRAGQG